ncbi:hypothetical protein ACFQVA_16150 [Actinomadura keratinilytica]
MRAKAAELLPELGLLIAEAPVALPGGTPGIERALDAYAAAGTVLDGARDLADLAGVVALVEEGTAPIRAAMNAARPAAGGCSRRPVPAQPHTPLTCFFNPFHGLATAGEVSWRMLGRRDLLTVAVCAECAAALAARRTRSPSPSGTRAASSRTTRSRRSRACGRPPASALSPASRWPRW